jgi:membrane-associated phospholipid phosphatase
MAKLKENWILIIQMLFLFGFILLNLINKVVPSIELLLAFCVLIFIWRSKDRKLLFSLLPFFILYLVFQSLRGFADNLSPSQVHVTEIINLERMLFGGRIPSHYLQVAVQRLPEQNIFDLVCNLVYMSHFINPLIVALLLWFKKPGGYWYFVGGLLVISYLAFIVFYLYPAAPPWWATKYGYLKDQPVYLSDYYQMSSIIQAGPNPVAAMPSLHMAYPTFIALILLYHWHLKAAPILLLPATVAFAALYLGHHYFVDLVAGGLLSLSVFGAIVLIARRREKKLSLSTQKQNLPVPDL